MSSKRAPSQKTEAGVVRRVIDRVLQRSMDDLEREYREDREEQATKLFNRFYAVVQDVRPDAATLLFVLREIEFIMLMTETNERIGPGSMIVRLPDDLRRKAEAAGRSATGPADPSGSKPSAIPQAIG